MNADLIDHSLSDPTKEVKAHEVARYTKLRQELGLAECAKENALEEGRCAGQVLIPEDGDSIELYEEYSK